jgi:hypothetical protein
LVNSTPVRWLGNPAVNAPSGKRYNTAMGALLEEYGFGGFPSELAPRVPTSVGGQKKRPAQASDARPASRLSGPAGEDYAHGLI